MREQPSITLCYIAVSRGVKTYDYAARFVGSFLEHPPGVDVHVVVACNGGALDIETGCLFAPLTSAALSCTLYDRVNDEGKDLSAYQDVASKCRSEIFVAMGESVHFHRSNWLVPMVNAWAMNGPGMYGFFSSHLVRPHMNTTAFCCAPQHLLEYPRIRKKEQRYEAEHGKGSLWKMLQARHVPTAFVTWDGIWPPGTWRYPENIMWRGTQENLLIWCNHVDRWFAANPETRMKWSFGADATFELANKP